MKKKYIYSTGKRKTSSARIFAEKGNGIIKINNKKIKKYFTQKKYKIIILEPLHCINYINKLNLSVTVKGGGISSQAHAIKHGISKILVQINKKFKKILKKRGFITRDSRKVERKKVGCHKSRKKPQFSKR